MLAFLMDHRINVYGVRLHIFGLDGTSLLIYLSGETKRQHAPSTEREPEHTPLGVSFFGSKQPLCHRENMTSTDKRTEIDRMDRSRKNNRSLYK